VQWYCEVSPEVWDVTKRDNLALDTLWYGNLPLNASEAVNANIQASCIQMLCKCVCGKKYFFCCVQVKP